MSDDGSSLTNRRITRMVMGERVLYVGGLSETISDDQLGSLLGGYGVVAHAYVVRHKHSGKSAGYGFVEMGSGEQALNAVVCLEGAMFNGNCLRLYVTPYGPRSSNLTEKESR
jgi:RNA recognition motif-containing protein